jgi:hypothetical protein
VLAELHDTQFMLFGNLEKSVLGNAIRKKCQKKKGYAIVLINLLALIKYHSPRLCHEKFDAL